MSESCHAMQSGSRKEQEKSSLPSLQQILDIGSSIRQEGLPKALLEQKNIPQTLLIAAKKGVQEKSCCHQSATKALVDALIQCAKGAETNTTVVTKALKGVKKPPRRTNNVPLSQVHAETAARAKRWAIDLLAESVHSNVDDKWYTSVSSKRVQSRGAAVFVAPQDAVQREMITCYSQSIINLCQRVMLSSCEAKISRTVDSALETLSAVSNLNWCTGVVQQLLACRSNFVTLTARHGIQPSNSTTAIQGFLAAYTKAAPVALQKATWDTLIRQAQLEFERDSCMTLGKERIVTRTLAMTAARNIEMHWIIMDGIRNKLDGTGAPFSLRKWESRRLSRALLSQTLNILDHTYAKSDGKQGANLNGLINRFPLHMRPLVRFVSLVVASLNRMPPAKKIDAVSTTLDNLAKVTLSNGYPCPSPNLQASLICIEGYLEQLFWTSMYHLGCQRKDSRKTTSTKKLDHALHSISRILVAVHTSRDPAVSLTEFGHKATATVKTTENFLRSIWEGKFLKNGKENTVVVTGLMSVAISGLLYSGSINFSKQEFNRLTTDEKADLRRGIELGFEWYDGNSLLHMSESILRELGFGQGNGQEPPFASNQMR